MTANQPQPAWPLQKPQQLVYLEFGADNGGMMLGICEQGLSYRAASPLKADGPVSFTFALDGKTRLEGTGEIVWSEEGGKTGGLRFTSVPPQFRELLRGWLLSESTPKSVGREVIPSVALPLDSISNLKSDVRLAMVEDANETAPLLPEPVPAAVEPIAEIPVETGPGEATPLDPMQLEEHVPTPVV